MKLCDQQCVIHREKHGEQLRIQVPPLLVYIILSSTTVVLMGFLWCLWGKKCLVSLPKRLVGESDCFLITQRNIAFRGISALHVPVVLLWLTTDSIHLKGEWSHCCLLDWLKMLPSVTSLGCAVSQSKCFVCTCRFFLKHACLYILHRITHIGVNILRVWLLCNKLTIFKCLMLY